jgi:hypothetical protein
VTSATAPNLKRHFTDQQIEDALRFALDVVEKLEPPDDLRVAAFNAAWGMRGMYYQQGSPVLPVGPLGILNGG